MSVNSLIYKEFLVSVDILWIGQLRVCLAPPPCAQAAGRQGRSDRRPRCPGTIATEHALPGELPCYGIYEAGDGRYIALGVLEKKFWQAFCDEVAQPDLMTRHWVNGEEAAAVRAEVAAIFRSNSQSYWANRFADIDCCVAPVLTLAESMANEQLCARDVHRCLAP